MVHSMCGFQIWWHIEWCNQNQIPVYNIPWITASVGNKRNKQRKQRPPAGARWRKLWPANQGSLFFFLLFTSLCPCLHFVPVPPVSRDSLVEELQSSRVTVVAVDLAVGLVQGGGVGKGGGEGVVVRSREGVSWWREERFGIVQRSGNGRWAVVLIGGGGAFSGTQGLSLWQLISQLWYTFLFLLEWKHETKLETGPKNMKHICAVLKTSEKRKLKVNLTICHSSHDIYCIRQDRVKFRI